MSSTSELWELINRGRAGKNIGLKFGLPKIEKIIGGIQPHRYLLCAAGSSVGKTSFIIFIMYQILRYSKKPINFLYFSLEIGAEILQAKLMGLYCSEEFGIYLTTNDILSFEKPISEYELQCLEKARQWLDSISHRLVILDKGLSANALYRETLTYMESKGEMEQNEDKEIFVPNNPDELTIGVIDHLNLLRPTQGNTKKTEIDLTSSYMVTLKRKFPITWFALMQQNRDSSSMDRRKAELSEPTLIDIKESGSPSEDADLVIQMFSPFREKLVSYRGYKILGDDGLKNRLVSILITKNRYGIANQVVPVAFYGEVSFYKELPLPNEINTLAKYIPIEDNIPRTNTKDSEEKDSKTHFKF